MDREKVIKGLHAHATGCGYRSDYCDAIECPYRYGDESCDIEEICRDVLELLKEQEAVDPEVEVLNEIDRIYRCPRCHKCFFYAKQKFCDQCGQAVKWDA